MKLSIRKIQNVWLRRAAIVPASAISFALGAILSLLAILFAAIWEGSIGAFKLAKHEATWWIREYSRIFSGLKKMWAKDFKND